MESKPIEAAWERYCAMQFHHPSPKTIFYFAAAAMYADLGTHISEEARTAIAAELAEYLSEVSNDQSN